MSDVGIVVAGTLPHTDERLVKVWTGIYREQLVAYWVKAQTPDSLEPIDPLA
jgi:hypothetical protein